MICENIIAFKGPHPYLNLKLLRLDVEDVAVALKLGKADVQKAYCENNFTTKITLKLSVVINP